MTMTIGERVRKVRLDAKLSLRAFGIKVATDHSTISRIEKDQREIPPRTQKLICLEFNINEDWLLTGEGKIYIDTKYNSVVSDAVIDLMLSENLQRQEILLDMAKLDEEEIKAIGTIIRSMASQKEDKKK